MQALIRGKIGVSWCLPQPFAAAQPCSGFVGGLPTPVKGLGDLREPDQSRSMQRASLSVVQAPRLCREPWGIHGPGVGDVTQTLAEVAQRRVWGQEEEVGWAPSSWAPVGSGTPILAGFGPGCTFRAVPAPHSPWPVAVVCCGTLIPLLSQQ